MQLMEHSLCFNCLSLFYGHKSRHNSWTDRQTDRQTEKLTVLLTEELLTVWSTD